jgi:hypothetical protein
MAFAASGGSAQFRNAPLGQGYMWINNDLFLGSKDTNVRWRVGTAAPTSGTWQSGDVVWNANATAGGNAGWICVAAGTPGTWKTWGTIAS